MPESNSIAVIFFRKTKEDYEFYLTRLHSNFPVKPSTWIPVASVIFPEDKELFSEIQNKYGDIAPDMLYRLTSLRMILEKKLFSLDDVIEVEKDEDPYSQISKIDPEYLNVWLHSMIPCGYNEFSAGEMKIIAKVYLFISPSTPRFQKADIYRTSRIFQPPNNQVEVKAKWYSASRILKNYFKLQRLFDPILIVLLKKLKISQMGMIEAAREMEEKKEITSMETSQILPNIWQFITPAPTLPPYHTTNVYVIGNEHKYIIDPGSSSPEDLKDLLLFVERNVESIDGILLTNHNPDHCNMTLMFKEKFDIPLFASPKTAEILEKEGFVFNSILKEGSKISLGTFPPLKIEKWRLETVELPGSSKGSIGFWDPRGVFFSGIALHKDLTISTYNYPESFKDLLESFNKLKKYPAKFVLSGHGTVITNMKKIISENRKRIQRINTFVIEQLKKGISTKDEIIELFILEKSPQWRSYVRHLISANLEKLVLEQKAVKIGDDYILKKKKNKR
jgi:glyoxylase-like metal-dependent hydrolase (beta-lactamase superfamily II)